MIRNALITDAEEIAEIYNHYVLHTIITFDETAVIVNEMGKKMAVSMVKYPWLVYEENNKILGYAYGSEWKSRCAYFNTVECSIYLRQNAIGKGLGSSLYSTLLKKLKSKNVHVVIGGIALPNDHSVALHEKFGFEKVAHFKQVGYKFKRWIDVGYWQLIID